MKKGEDDLSLLIVIPYSLGMPFFGKSGVGRLLGRRFLQIPLPFHADPAIRADNEMIHQVYA